MESLLPFHCSVGVSASVFCTMAIGTSRLELEKADAEIVYVDGVALTTISQTYVNGPAAGTATFTLPNLAQNAVYALELKTPRATTVATLKSIQSAKADYASAVKEGRTAALATIGSNDNSITLSIGAVAPNDTVVATFRFASLVERLTATAFKVGLPLVYFARYGGDSTYSFGVKSAQSAFTAATTTVRLRFQRDFPKTVTAIGASSVTMTPEGYTATVVGASTDIFFSVITAAPEAPQGLCAPLKDGTGYATVATKHVGYSHWAPPLDVTVIADCSGSMHGHVFPTRATIVGQGIAELLGAMKASSDEFRLVTFGSSTVFAVPTTQIPADEAQFADLKNEVARAVKIDMGGTEMYRAIEFSEKQRIQRVGGQRVHLLITDGEVEDREGERCSALVARLYKTQGVCTFVIGIGHGVNAAQLRDIARHGGGMFFTARNAVEVITIVQHLLPLMRQHVFLKPKASYLANGTERPAVLIDAWAAAPVEAVEQAPVPMALDEAEPVVTSVPARTAVRPAELAHISPDCLRSGTQTAIFMVTPERPTEVRLTGTNNSIKTTATVNINIVPAEGELVAGLSALVGHELLVPAKERGHYPELTQLALATGTLCKDLTGLVATENVVAVQEERNEYATLLQSEQLGRISRGAPMSKGGPSTSYSLSYFGGFGSPAPAVSKSAFFGSASPSQSAHSFSSFGGAPAPFSSSFGAPATVVNQSELVMSVIEETKESISDRCDYYRDRGRARPHGASKSIKKVVNTIFGAHTPDPEPIQVSAPPPQRDLSEVVMEVLRLQRRDGSWSFEDWVRLAPEINRILGRNSSALDAPGACMALYVFLRSSEVQGSMREIVAPAVARAEAYFGGGPNPIPFVRA
jgi:hypothetical protein